MLRTIAMCLTAAALVAAPASAQVNREAIRPGVNAVQNAQLAAVGNASLAGVWHTTGVICARLSLTKDDARRVTGNIRMGSCGSPDYNGVEMPCSGWQHANNQFSFDCHHSNGPFYVFVGRVVVDPPVATQRGAGNPQAVGPAFPAARIEGRMHQTYFTSNPEPAYLIDHAIAATRAAS
jgi:hypothetical protein